jgi:hypothetical protein
MESLAFFYLKSSFSLTIVLTIFLFLPFFFQNGMLPNVWRSKQQLFISGGFNELVNHEALLSLTARETLMLYFQTLNNLTNLLEYATGKDVVFTKKALEADAAFVEFKQKTNNTNAKTNKFFTNYGVKTLGFVFSSQRGKNTKYTIHNKELNLGLASIATLYRDTRLYSKNNFRAVTASLVSTKDDLRLVHHVCKDLFTMDEYKQMLSALV